MHRQELFKIGEVAQMFHLSVGLLRHYAKAGLLSPEYTDPDTGYRYYSTRQLECLNTIRYLRALDMPLEQIADFLQNRDLDKIQEMLEQQRSIVIHKQQELQIIERKITNRLQQLQDALSSAVDTITLQQSRPRRIAWLRDKLSLQSHLDLEASIRQLENKQKHTSAFLGKIGVGISRERLLQRQYNTYEMVFLILDDEDTYEGHTELLPATTCVSLRFCGGHREAPPYYHKLQQYIAAQHLTISGFSREITMIDYGLTNDTSKFITEIQIPVQKEYRST